MNYIDYKELVKAERAEAKHEGFMWGFVATFCLGLAAFAYLIQ
ncbi:hypothetical protein [Leeuwenhoekiella sp. LLG6367-2.1]|tara:strand:- start:75 stop:203 length:129 start_codon:yes stop_codon:yes gene_type:complete